MRTLLKATAVALALCGAALATAGTAGADPYDHERDRGGTTVSIGLGNIAFGYRDGYWDNDRHWHRWSHHNDYKSYRDGHRSNYYDGNHDRYRGNGWQRD